MSYGLGRSFSFNNDDEASLSASNTDRHSHLTQDNNTFRDSQPSAPPYTDSPTRQYRDNPPPPPVHRSSISPTRQLPESIPYEPPSPRPRVRLNTSQAQNGGYSSTGLDHSTSNRTASTITPGADNMGDRAAGGGISGIAYGIANINERESGVEALRSMENTVQRSQELPPERDFDTLGTTTPYVPNPPNRSSYGRDPFASPAPSRRSNPFDDGRGSEIPSPGDLTPRGNRSTHSIPMAQIPSHDVYDNRDSFADNPYKRFSTVWDPRVSRGDINPDDIEDDGDDAMQPPLRSRRSFLGMGNQPGSEGTAAAASAGAASGGVLGALGGLVGRNKSAPTGSRDVSGQYGPVPGSSGPGMEDAKAERSPWLTKQTSGRKRLRWIIGILGILIVVGAIVGGVIGGLNRNKSDTSSSDDDSDDTSISTPSHPSGDGDLDLNSPKIKKLLNNPDFHKVFPGMDYTPFNAQYPECLSNMPIQDNVTMDVAVLSQLTNAVRLYGTDCNQTEMVLHAIDKLEIKDMKVWLGVWLDGNQTTQDRGISAMYDLLSKNPADKFAGVIIGNEVLYRKEMTESELGKVLTDVRQNLTSQKIDLPVATSDLGDDWTAELAKDTDIVMSNIHPFFAGVVVDKAAGWTIDFWQQHDTKLITDQSKNIISETGWPSDGGTDCGTDATTCTPGQGSVAGIDEMNSFMDDFVCQALTNGTNYFWFEAFDEPWKIKLNEPGKEWEDKWGLMDPARKLKPGLKIPDCGGKTVGS